MSMLKVGIKDFDKNYNYGELIDNYVDKHILLEKTTVRQTTIMQKFFEFLLKIASLLKSVDKNAGKELNKVVLTFINGTKNERRKE